MVIITFQGFSLKVSDFGLEIHDLIAKSLLSAEMVTPSESENNMEVGKDENEGEGETGGLNLFSSLTLPKKLPQAVERVISHKTVIWLTEGAVGWKGLHDILCSATSDYSDSDNNDSGDEGACALHEIFAVSGLTTSTTEEEDDIVKASYLLNESSRDNEQGSLQKSRVFKRLIKILSTGGDNGPCAKDEEFAWVELDDKENPSQQFKTLGMNAKSLTFHWFHAFPRGFIWRKTVGSTMKNINSKLKELNSGQAKWLSLLLNDGKDNNHVPQNNFVCISGEAGMGKSVLLTGVAHELKARYKNRLVCYIDLIRFNKIMKTLDAERSLKSMNCRLFIQLICEYFGITSDLEKSVLKKLLSSKKGGAGDSLPKAELLLDGLDCMDPEMGKLLLKFLKNYLGIPDEWNFRLWLTTRPNMKKKLEEKFCLVAFELGNLECFDIVTYFQSCGVDYAHEIVKESLEHHLKLDLSGLLSIPACMTAFQTLLSGRDRAGDLYSLTGIEILRKMMENVKERCILSGKMSNKDVNTLILKHVDLACLTILRRIVTNSENKNDKDYMIMSLRERKSVDIRLGIVTKDVDQGKHTFIHESFIYFLLADYYANVKPSSERPYLTRFFLYCFLFKDECEPIRFLYSQLLKKGVALDVSDGWMRKARKFLTNIYDLAEDTLEHERIHSTGNLLQLALIDQNLLLAKFIMDAFSISNCREELKRLIKMKVKVVINSAKWRNVKKEVRNGSEEGSSILHGGYLVPEEENSIELSSLSLAIMFGDAELVHLMYNCLGHEPESDEHLERFTCMDICKYLALHLGVIGCNTDTLNYLMRYRKLSPNKLDSHGLLPLHLCFYNGWDLKFYAAEPPPSSFQSPRESSSSVIFREIRIQKYYNDLTTPGNFAHLSEIRDCAGQRPLLASQAGSDFFVKMQMGRDENFHYKERTNPSKITYYKSIKSYTSIIERLSGRTLINIQKRAEGVYALVDPPFHMACSEGYFPNVGCMRSKGVNINIKTSQGYTALFSAIKKGHIDIVRYLLDIGIDTCDLHRVTEGFPLVHYLTSLNLPNMLKFFVNEREFQSVDLRLEDGRTPLHVACENGDDECLDSASALLEMGADVNAGDKSLMTPLLFACDGEPFKKTGNFKLIKLLLENEADPNAQRDSGESALHYFADRMDFELFQHFMKCAGGKEKIKMDLKATRLGVKDQTPLHFACMIPNNLQILQGLIGEEKNVDVNAVNSHMQTPLAVLALVQGQKYGKIDEEMAEYLVEHRVDMMLKDKFGSSPLHKISKLDRKLADKLLKIYVNVTTNYAADLKKNFNVRCTIQEETSDADDSAAVNNDSTNGHI